MSVLSGLEDVSLFFSAWLPSDPEVDSQLPEEYRILLDPLGDDFNALSVFIAISGSAVACLWVVCGCDASHAVFPCVSAGRVILGIMVGFASRRWKSDIISTAPLHLTVLCSPTWPEKCKTCGFAGR